MKSFADRNVVPGNLGATFRLDEGVEDGPDPRRRDPLAIAPLIGASAKSGGAAFPARWRVRTISSQDECLALESEWLSLEERCPAATIFQTFRWCKAWIEAAKAVDLPETLRIVTIRSGPLLVLVWPLALRMLYGARLAHWLGEPATQYGDVLMEPSAYGSSWLAAAWHEIKSWRDVDGVELRRVRADSAVGGLRELSGDAHAIARDAAPFVDFDHLQAHLAESLGRGGRTHNSLRRHLRRLEKVGRVDFDVIAGAPDQIRAVSEALRFKQRWLADKGRTSAGHSHPANTGFLHTLAAQGALRVARLSVGGVPAAFEIGMIMHDRRYYSMLQSYDSRLAAYGLGQLLLWRVLSLHRESGISVFDFLAPAQVHKQRWASSEMPVRDYFMALSPRGTAAEFGIRFVKPALRWTFERLPSRARRALTQTVSLRSVGH